MRWDSLSEKESQKQMSAFRICCALAAKKKEKYSLEIGSEEQKVVKKIGEDRGIGSKYVEFVFKQIGNDKVSVENQDKYNKEKRLQIEKILCDVFRVICADYYISDQEKAFFDFLCIRLGIFNGETRKTLYKHCEKKALLENIKDFNSHIENEIKIIIEKGRVLEKQEKTYPSEYNLEKELSVFDKNIEKLYDRIDKLKIVIDENKDYIEKLIGNPNDKDIDNLKGIYERILSGYITFWATENKKRKEGYEELKTLYKEWDSLFKELNEHLNNALNDKNKVKYDRDELKYITVGSLGDYRDYIKAVVRIERDTDEVAQSELEQHGEINKSHGKDLARYIDYIANDEQLHIEKKNLIFDLFNVILADDKIEEKEDLLFKTCAIVLNIGAEEYREIKDLLYDFQARTRNLSIDERYSKRRYVTKRIKKILESDKLSESKQARFSLVCSMAFVDGELRIREKVELYDIGMRDYYLTERQIDVILSNLDDKNKRSQYFTEMLVNVPKAPKEKLMDLRNCMRIICSDDEITDAERNAFEMVCVFYGVDKAFFSDSKYVNKETKSIPDKYLKDIDDEKRVIISREAYEKIEHILKHKQVQGPLCGGISYALDKRYNEHCRSMARSDRKTTKYAFVIFSISALLLLVLINHHGVGSFEKGKYHHELQEYKGYKKDLTYYNAAVDYISDSLKTIAKDSVAIAEAEDYIAKVPLNIDTKEINDIYKVVVKSGNDNIKTDTDAFNRNRCKDFVDSLVKKYELNGHTEKMYSSIDSAVSDIEKNTGHSVYCREQAIRLIKKSINEKGNLFLLKIREHQDFSGEDSLLKNCVKAFKEGRYLDCIGELIMWIENGAAYIFDECHKWLSNFKNLGWLIFITVVCVFIPTLRLRLARILEKHNLYAISVLLIVSLAVSGELQTAVLLLSTMLSIEWLILMREKEAHGNNAKEESLMHEKEVYGNNAKEDSKKSHSSLLAILVIMAILADISFGMIELEQLYTLKNVSDKVFSALFLGCICFFVGKFMEMQYIHNEDDKKVMKEKLDKISEYVKEPAQIPCDAENKKC